ncbi:MAG: adenylate/guanylate cyclase domain-containing protein, partial [Chitinophagales bacterium]
CIMVTTLLTISNIVIYFSPFMILYFLFIVLSTLHLDLWLSVITGVVAAVEYLFASEILLGYVPLTNSDYDIMTSQTIIIMKCILILLCGVASGFVGTEIKRRVINTSKALNERNRVRQILGQQVLHEIVDEILREGKEIGTSRVNVCVMFLDIRNFTPFASQHTPEEVMDYQNKLFGNLIDIVNKHSGIINQIMGDGFMATFGAPLSHGNDCRHAVDAALEILDWTQRACNEEFIHPTRLGIGIHYGEAITGNIGTELRKQFSIVGNVVICASRIEQLNKQFHSQLLISKDVLEKSVDGKMINAESLGAVPLKGEKEPMEIFKVM